MAKKSKSQTPEEIAEERIAAWKRDPLKPHPKLTSVETFGANTTWLSLASLGLKAVPASLRTVHQLELLVLDRNKIKELPGWIGELSELKLIAIDRNQLRELPPEISSLRKLAFLSLFRNELETLPEALSTLPLVGLQTIFVGKKPDRFFRASR